MKMEACGRIQVQIDSEFIFEKQKNENGIENYDKWTQVLGTENNFWKRIINGVKRSSMVRITGMTM